MICYNFPAIGKVAEQQGEKTVHVAGRAVYIPFSGYVGVIRIYGSNVQYLVGKFTHGFGVGIAGLVSLHCIVIAINYAVLANELERIILLVKLHNFIQV